MNRTWLIVILLTIVAVVTLAYTWQNIPILNTFLIDTGVISTIGDATSGITTAINNLDPKSLLGIITGSLGSLFLVGKTLITRLKESREQANALRVGFQQEKGTLLSGFEDVKAQITGAKDQLQGEYDELLTQKADLEATLTMKDNAIIDVQSELGKAQAQVIATQNELKTTIKEMDEYRIALEQKALPTTH